MSGTKVILSGTKIILFGTKNILSRTKNILSGQMDRALSSKLDKIKGTGVVGHCPYHLSALDKTKFSLLFNFLGPHSNDYSKISRNTLNMFIEL